MSWQINSKSVNIAISAYLMLFFSWLMLFNKSNPNIDNNFVKWHIKSSIIIHSLFLINSLVFFYFKFLSNFQIFWLKINIILANFFFIMIWIFMIKWIHSAYKNKNADIWNTINITKVINLDINSDSIIDEKDKLTIILTHIPFIGYIVWWKYKNEKIQSILKLNILLTIFILLVYISSYDNFATILLLIYLIFITFSATYLYWKEKLISVNLPDYFSPNILLLNIKTLFIYIFLYFKWDFKDYKIIKEKLTEKELIIKEKESELLDKKDNSKLLKWLVYIPIINFIFIKEKNTKLEYHKRNWYTISFIFIFTIILSSIWFINSSFILFSLFPICFWIWKVNINYYKMPFIYDIYEIFIKIKNKFIHINKIIKEKKWEVNEVKFKVK